MSMLNLFRCLTGGAFVCINSYYRAVLATGGEYDGN